MYKDLIRTIKNGRFTEKRAAYFLANVSASAQNERRMAQCDLSNTPILTDEEVFELEEIVRYYTDRIIAAKKAAKTLGLSERIFERGGLSDLYWSDDRIAPMAI
jgi:signal transduction histidine kinase